MEPHAACKLPPPAVLFAAQCTLLAGSELPSVSALASLPLWTPSFFFFFSQAEHNLHISSFIFNLSATSLRAQHRRGGPIEVEWALPSLMSGYPSKYCKILIWRLSSPPRYIKWLLFHWWSDILFLWSSLSEAQLCFSGDLWPILLL